MAKVIPGAGDSHPAECSGHAPEFVLLYWA